MPGLRPTALIDSDHPAVQAFAAEHARGATDRERAVALVYAVRDGFRYDPYRIDLSPAGMTASTRAGQRLWLVRAQGHAAGGGLPRGRHPGAPGLCRRAQPPVHRAHAPDHEDRPVRLARLHRHLDRRRLAQGHAGLQPGAVRALRPAAAGVRRRARFDLPPVRPGRATVTWSTCISAAASTTCRWRRSWRHSEEVYGAWLPQGAQTSALHERRLSGGCGARGARRESRAPERWPCSAALELEHRGAGAQVGQEAHFAAVLQAEGVEHRAASSCAPASSKSAWVPTRMLGVSYHW